MRTIFYLENVWNTLKTKGTVATLRNGSYIRSIGKYTNAQFIKDSKVIEKIPCKIIKVIENPSYKDLKKYLKLSGFSSVDNWLNTAKKLHKRLPKYLVILRCE